MVGCLSNNCKSNTIISKDEKVKKTFSISSDSMEKPEGNFVEPPPASHITVTYPSFKKWIASIDSASKSKSADTVFHFKLFTINSKPSIYVLESDNDNITKSSHVALIGGSYVFSSDDFNKSANNNLVSDIGKELLRLSKSNEFKFFNAITRFTVGFDERDMIVYILHK